VKRLRSGLARWVRVAEPSFGCKALGDELVWGPAVQDPLTPGIVGSTEPAKQLLKIAVKVDRGAQHFAVDAGIEAFPFVRGA
jgi:hypothetical protein